MTTNFIELKYLKDPTEESDGLRVLIARFRPRYLPKKKKTGMNGGKNLLRANLYGKNILKVKR